MQALLDKTPSLPADNPAILRLAIQACCKESHIVAQIIGKGVDPDIAGKDGRDALAFLKHAIEHNRAWAKETEKLEQVLVATMVSQRRGKKRKAADHGLKDVSAGPQGCTSDPY
jgi:predicted Fe-Mo cluster-binding NifX family protein